MIQILLRHITPSPLPTYSRQRLQDAKDAAREALRIDITYQPVLSLLQAIEPSIPATPQVAVLPTEQPDVIEKTR